MSLIDTHAHLDDDRFATDLPDVLDRAAVAGVVRVVTIATTAQIASIEIPSGYSEAKPGAAPDAKVRPVPVTWRIRALREGNHALTVTTDSGLTQTHRVTINRKSLFN